MGETDKTEEGKVTREGGGKKLLEIQIAVLIDRLTNCFKSFSRSKERREANMVLIAGQ